MLRKCLLYTRKIKLNDKDRISNKLIEFEHGINVLFDITKDQSRKLMETNDELRLEIARRDVKIQKLIDEIDNINRIIK